MLAVCAIAAAALLALALGGFGGALTSKAARQRATDLAAICAAQAMREAYPRLFVSPGRGGGPALTRAGYLDVATRAAGSCARGNGLDEPVAVRFADPRSPAPLAVTVRARGAEPIALGARERVLVRTRATAEMAPSAAAPMPSASSGEYRGPFAYRQGKSMRPDVAQAFDRMAAAARREAGLTLMITSAFRSDSEQARLFAQRPDPRWVARPGTSLHRLGTELDLGPQSAYGWLAANASRFGFTQRYSWEPWHYGYVRSPGSTSVGFGRRGGAGGGGGGGALPAFVPARYRAPILRASQRWSVSAALLAAQLQAESGFDPGARSGAGAQGIAQFMPGTARAYGLDDPFDPEASIDAQARLMRELLGRFASVPLALAAYNAGAGAVARCGCIPPYPETEAYVARILALLDAAGEGVAPSFTVRLRR